MARKLSSSLEKPDAMAEPTAFDVWLKKGLRSLHDTGFNEPLSDQLIALLRTLGIDEAE